MRNFTIFIKNSLVATILTRVKRMKVPSIYNVNHPSVDEYELSEESKYIEIDTVQD